MLDKSDVVISTCAIKLSSDQAGRGTLLAHGDVARVSD